MDAMRVGCLGTKSICLIFQYIQQGAEYFDRSPYLSLQRLDCTEMGNGNDLPRCMCMLFA